MPITTTPISVAAATACVALYNVASHQATLHFSIHTLSCSALINKLALNHVNYAGQEQPGRIATPSLQWQAPYGSDAD